MRKLLLATSNQGKVREMRDFLSTLPFELISVSDLDKTIEPPEENGATTEENAILKARYYAEQTGLLTYSEDAGLFIPALDNWPGVRTARVGNTPDELCDTTLRKMSGVEDRTAIFRATAALVDPENNSLFIAHGETKGEITKEVVDGQNIWGYNRVFYVPEEGMTYAEMTHHQKNGISHRGKALQKMKYHLQNTYSGRHIVVPIALIIKDGKMLMDQRNDPHRPENHEKWEFPGGSVEHGETVEQTLLREVEEETGYEIEIVEQLQYIGVKSHAATTYKYQIYLIPYVCTIIGGDGVVSDSEVIQSVWQDIERVGELDLFDGDKEIYEGNMLPQLKEILSRHTL